MGKAKDISGLTAPRAALDALDDEICALLARRTALIGDIIRAKSAHANADEMGGIIRPAREAMQMRRLIENGAAGDFSRIALLRLWREIIGASVAQQAAQLGDEPLYVLSAQARVADLYFGACLDFVVTDSAQEVCDALRASGRGLGLVGAKALGAMLEAELIIVGRVPDALAPEPVFCIAPHADREEADGVITLCLETRLPADATALTKLDEGYIFEAETAPETARVLARYPAPISVAI